MLDVELADELAGVVVGVGVLVGLEVGLEVGGEEALEVPLLEAERVTPASTGGESSSDAVTSASGGNTLVRPRASSTTAWRRPASVIHVIAKQTPARTPSRPFICKTSLSNQPQTQPTVQSQINLRGYELRC